MCLINLNRTYPFVPMTLGYRAAKQSVCTYTVRLRTVSLHYALPKFSHLCDPHNCSPLTIAKRFETPPEVDQNTTAYLLSLPFIYLVVYRFKMKAQAIVVLLLSFLIPISAADLEDAPSCGLSVQVWTDGVSKDMRSTIEESSGGLFRELGYGFIEADDSDGGDSRKGRFLRASERAAERRRQLGWCPSICDVIDNQNEYHYCSAIGCLPNRRRLTSRQAESVDEDIEAVQAKFQSRLDFVCNDSKNPDCRLKVVVLPMKC